MKAMLASYTLNLHSGVKHSLNWFTFHWFVHISLETDSNSLCTDSHYTDSFSTDVLYINSHWIRAILTD